MNIEALLNQARDDRGKTVIQRQVDLVLAYGEHEKLGGEKNYKSSLSAIVASHGTTGVKYSLVREVLHDTEQLNAAVKDLVETKAIVKGDGKRDFLLTTTKKSVDEPKGGQPQSDQPDASDDAGSGEVPPTDTQPPVQPKK